MDCSVRVQISVLLDLQVNYVKNGAKVLLFFDIRKSKNMFYGTKVRKVYIILLIFNSLTQKRSQKKYGFCTLSVVLFSSLLPSFYLYLRVSIATITSVCQKSIIVFYWFVKKLSKIRLTCKNVCWYDFCSASLYG